MAKVTVERRYTLADLSFEEIDVVRMALSEYAIQQEGLHAEQTEVVIIARELRDEIDNRVDV